MPSRVRNEGISMTTNHAPTKTNGKLEAKSFCFIDLIPAFININIPTKNNIPEIYVSIEEPAALWRQFQSPIKLNIIAVCPKLIANWMIGFSAANTEIGELRLETSSG